MSTYKVYTIYPKMPGSKVSPTYGVQGFPGVTIQGQAASMYNPVMVYKVKKNGVVLGSAHGYQAMKQSLPSLLGA